MPMQRYVARTSRQSEESCLDSTRSNALPCPDPMEISPDIFQIAATIWVDQPHTRESTDRPSNPNPSSYAKAQPPFPDNRNPIHCHHQQTAAVPLRKPMPLRRPVCAHERYLSSSPLRYAHRAASLKADLRLRYHQNHYQ